MASRLELARGFVGGFVGGLLDDEAGTGAHRIEVEREVGVPHVDEDALEVRDGVAPALAECQGHSRRLTR